MRLWFALLMIIAVQLCLLLPSKAEKTEETPPIVVELTDLNFDRLVSNDTPWMINIMAPWCPACQQTESAWNGLAPELHPDIKVGKIDGTAQRSLMSRFQITHFPSIFHVYKGEIREYTGNIRTVEKLAEFAREGWKSVEPKRGCRSPTSMCGRVLGHVSKVPAQAKAKYLNLRDNGTPDLVLLAVILSVPVMIGVSIICFLDAMVTRGSRRQAQQTWRPHVD